MKKNEKRGITIALSIIILAVIGLMYAVITKKNIDTNGSMYSLGISYLIAGFFLVVYFIRLSKNKKKSDEQENIYQDERINNNRNKACAITFKIIIWSSLIADYIVTFFLEQYQELANTLNVFTGFTIAIYLITYYFISKRNW